MSSCSLIWGIPAAAMRVGSRSCNEMIPFETVPAGIMAGQRIIIGIRYAPSQLLFFSPRNGVMLPSGQEKTCAPLSVVKITIVFSAIPRSSSHCSSWPTYPSSSTMPSAWEPRPVEPSVSGLRCVQMCMRVGQNQLKKGLPSFTDRSMKSSDAASSSSSIVSMRSVVRGPVSSITCRPTGPKRGSSVGSSTSEAHEWSTPRGP